MLDDPRAIAHLDSRGMLALVGRFGPMVADGWAAARDAPAPAGRISAIVICGMGGSGIGGDLLRAALAPASPIPVLVNKSDRLPAFVGSSTLVVACSYSGNTEETLAAYDAAGRAGAAVAAITSGGALATRARERGDAVVTVPTGLPPRSALPLLLMPMLRIAAKMRLIELADADVERTAATLGRLADEWGPARPLRENHAKGLAQTLHGARPVIYAASPLTEPVALRWKTQLNENSKVLAWCGAFPELGHNDVVGWDGAGDAASYHVVILRDEGDGAADARRVAVTRDGILGRARGCEEVWSAGTGPLARMLSLVLLGDFVSCYLAGLRGVDPTPVEAIDRLKARLAGA